MIIFLFFPSTFWKQKHSSVSTEWLFSHIFRLKPSVALDKVIGKTLWMFLFLPVRHTMWYKSCLILLAQPVKGFSCTVAFVSSAVFIPAFSYQCGRHALVALSCLMFWPSASSRMFCLTLKGKYCVRTWVEIRILGLLSVLFDS